MNPTFLIIAHIGENYKYPNSRNLLKLIKVIGLKYLFECGHWCTDNVFIDLIRVSNGVQVCNEKQLQLF